jgi:putative transposase
MNRKLQCPVRKRTRLSGYDYATTGSYFITLVVKNRERVLGNIAGGMIQLSLHGKIVRDQWQWLHQQYLYLLMDEYVVMPNHFHGIITMRENGREMKPLSQLIGAFKTTSSRRIHETGLFAFQWQKSFYDRIIRNEKELERVREYIHTNLLRWEFDIEFGKGMEMTPKTYYDEVLGL